MVKAILLLLVAGLPFSQTSPFPALKPSKESNDVVQDSSPIDTVKDWRQETFDILNAKCNVCHRKQNPFRVFSLKNMDKHAPKIYEQVFVKRRMPKGEQVKLTDQEYQTLQQWLQSHNIF